MTRLTCLGFTLAVMALSACRKNETFIEEERRFEAAETGADFSLRSVPKEIHRLVVNFFAPDCPPCEKEIPALKKFYDKHRETSVGFIAIGSSLKAIEQNPKPGKDPPLTRHDIKAELALFAKKFAQPYPHYLASGEDLKAWRITGFPETFIFSREGGSLRFRRKIISEVSFEDLEREAGR
jgi:thiol-disulfide isomerase/thioredoxin